MAVSKLKTILSTILYKSGIFGYLIKRKFKGNALILMYHRIVLTNQTPLFTIQPGMYVNASTFDEHIKILKRYFDIITLKELVNRILHNHDISHCCVISFDDGWKDNYELAFPIIKRHQIPATIFLATGFIGTEKWFWPELLLCIANKTEEALTSLPEFLDGNIRNMLLNSSKHNTSKDNAIEYVKNIHHNRRIQIAYQLQQICTDLVGTQRLLMNWDEVREMKRSNLIDFGSHTVNHELLDQLPFDNICSEIIESCSMLKNNTGDECELFAYPNGNYNKYVANVVRLAGYKAAVTTKRGYITKDCDLITLPRIAVHEDVSANSALFLWRILIK